MSWEVHLTRKAHKFLGTNNIQDKEIFDLVIRATSRFRGEDVNIDLKKLTGEWLGFWRVRKGRMRIIAEFDFDNLSVLIEVIDWRGNAYK
ncbi:MAG: hypothetical protein HY001_02045 [Candidatus Portnoybacteria bacterium]|nr:hypothetical protein [Candidatus Portnoybacteria bacterium]